METAAAITHGDWQEVFFSSGALAIYGLDLEGRCIFCNPAFLRIIGYPDEQQLIGKQIHDLIHHSHPDGAPYPADECLIHRTVSDIRCVHIENEVFWRPDGTSLNVEYWSHPILKEGKPAGTAIMFLDITERKRAQTRLEQAFRELDAFVHTVSHDLRSPLTSIMGYIEVLKMNCCKRDPSHCETVEIIEQESSRMAAILEDLLALARIGNIPRPSDPVEVGREVDAICHLLKSQYPQVTFRVAGDLSPPVHIPRTFIHQIFSNLIGNAARYGQSPGHPIEVGRRDLRHRIRFYVRDHGPGIPEGERESVFETFFRGTTGKDHPGTGIGLAIVQKIARNYNGQVWVEETPGGGSTFWIELNPK